MTLDSVPWLCAAYLLGVVAGWRLSRPRGVAGVAPPGRVLPPRGGSGTARPKISPAVTRDEWERSMGLRSGDRSPKSRAAPRRVWE